MALHTRKTALALATRIDTRRISRVSDQVCRMTGIDVPPNKAIVGRNAFAHEAGIHQDGMLKDQRTYEVMLPETVGRESLLVLGKHSGRHAFRVRLRTLGVELDEAAFESAFERFKRLADRRKWITDDDLRSLVRERERSRGAGGGELSRAAVSLSHEDWVPPSYTVGI